MGTQQQISFFYIQSFIDMLLGMPRLQWIFLNSIPTDLHGAQTKAQKYIIVSHHSYLGQDSLKSNSRTSLTHKGVCVSCSHVGYYQYDIITQLSTGVNSSNYLGVCSRTVNATWWQEQVLPKMTSGSKSRRRVRNAPL